MPPEYEHTYGLINNHGGHRFERAILGLSEAMHITAGHGGAVPRARAEKMAVTVEEGAKCFGDPLDQRYGQPSSAHTVT
jgi:hypothetical protein